MVETTHVMAFVQSLADPSKRKGNTTSADDGAADDDDTSKPSKGKKALRGRDAEVADKMVG